MRKLAINFWLGILVGLCCANDVFADATDSRVFVEGSSRDDEAVRSSGHDVPLLHALEQVVPASYSVNVPNAGAWADLPVSWRAQSSFVRVLGQLLAVKPGLEAHVNTDLKLVTVTARPVPPRTAAAAAHDTVGDASLAKTAMPPVISSPAASPSSSDDARQSDIVARSGALVPVAHGVTAAPQATQAMRADGATPAVPAMKTSAPGVALATKAAFGSVVSSSTASTNAPAPSAATLAAAPVAPVTEWKLNLADGTVRTVLARWATEAGWQFIWEVPTDFAVDASATIHGSFEDALNAVVDALSGAQVPIQVVLYKGNHVMRVVAKGAG
jgi:Toxin co-regulated pilus biosynthesis protein Q